VPGFVVWWGLLRSASSYGRDALAQGVNPEGLQVVVLPHGHIPIARIPSRPRGAHRLELDGAAPHDHLRRGFEVNRLEGNHLDLARHAFGYRCNKCSHVEMVEHKPAETR